MAAAGVTYCSSWNWRRHRPGIPLTEAEARARDAAGEDYIAVVPPSGVGPGGRHPVLVSVVPQNACIAVTFFDDPGRRAVKYYFFRSGEDRLFLRDVSLWEYPGDDPRLRLNESTKHEQIAFREDGYVKRVVVDKVERYKETTEHSDVSVAGNWEPVPEFGDYRSIARRER
jgi:hypothetical protein